MDSIEQMIAQQNAQQQAEQMLVATLRATLQQPAMIRQLNVCMVALGTGTGGNGGSGKVLHVALPSGERIDVPLSRMAETQLLRGLTGEADEPSEAA